MRLYDQRSNTPMKSDGKKWMRPNNFLPSQRDATAVSKRFNPLNKKRMALGELTDNTTCSSESSASTGIEISKVWKQHTIYDDFRFDIDEETIKSSSTLSTHTTLRYGNQDVVHGRYKNEFAKPTSLMESDAFETSSRYSKTSSITASVWESFASDTGANENCYLSNDDIDENNLNEDFLTPQLTLTQSSEESDSTWIEFNGFNSKNVFPTTSDRHLSNKLDRFPTQFSMNHQTRYTMPRSRNCDLKRHKLPSGTENYANYHTMLLDGVSVDKLLKAMEKDRVDPSIISLVLAASKISLNS